MVLILIDTAVNSLAMIAKKFNQVEATKLMGVPFIVELNSAKHVLSFRLATMLLAKSSKDLWMLPEKLKSF